MQLVRTSDQNRCHTSKCSIAFCHQLPRETFHSTISSLFDLETPICTRQVSGVLAAPPAPKNHLLLMIHTRGQLLLFIRYCGYLLMLR